MTTRGERGLHALDELAIKKLLSSLAQAQDDRDFDAYVKCFAETILIDQPMISGWKPVRMSSKEWARIGLARLALFDATHHRLFNHVIDIDGDDARCVVDLSAIHLLTVDGVKKDWSVGGRYHIRLRRQSNGAWLITERALVVRYQMGDESLIEKVNAMAESKGASTQGNAKS
jgi:hypothetical protein